nr:hypothetical protein [Tanacetum cinerariifolium]
MVPTKKGCEALVKRDTLTKPDKLKPRSIKCIFVGYPKKMIGYSFYYPPKNKVFAARNAEFLKNSIIVQEASGSLEDLKIIQEEDTHLSIDTSLNHEEGDQEINEPQSDINYIRRSTRTRRAPDQMCLYIDAEEYELGNLIDLPPNGKTIGHKWLFKKKTGMDGAVHTYKARLVAKGFTQTLRIGYEETFSHVSDIRAIRILIVIAAFYDYEIWQIDVKTGFFNGYLNEEGYTEQPQSFVNQKFLNRVCKLKRSIYGINGSYVTFLILYVDDILIMGNNIAMLQDVKSYLRRCFAMKDLGEAAYILGIKIYRDRSKRLISLYQTHANIPYASEVGLIMYVVRCTRPDVAFAQNITSRFQHNPGDTKRELRISCYIDAGYLTDADDMKSQTGYVFVLNGGVVDWKSTKQTIAKDHGVTKGARHFHAKVHYLRETIEMGDVKIEKVDTYDNLADPFTNALAFSKHSELTEKIRMIQASSLM